ncbi:DUF1501 domain-containing protein [Halieaceae bacterium IMCC14734]|uniref:DUF1501 domain-containing protein n=1 Tax=Candidatus Litorirhabdus singularis TaxID=2518993 RepID=A0ABT3TIH6_9GAMM|nr:DUF1501 domain-containing protein [Candidatus Litorirhabdus singularis]MCX2981814.1 DUF1501 domain-containing protein [Candidatus Litorirhabdus singularis]
MQTRRNFLKLSASAPLLMGAGSLLGGIPAMSSQAAEVGGYRALVCIFLDGGMDSHDTVIPYDNTSYQSFVSHRTSLMNAYDSTNTDSSRNRNNLLPLDPVSASFSGRQFSLPPQMAALHSLFDQGNAAIVGNVGPLLRPVDSAALEGREDLTPARLFSHNDQMSTWMSFAPEGSLTGWGGMFGDAVTAVSANREPVFSQISLGGNSVFLAGDTVGAYEMEKDGIPSIALIEEAGRNLPLTSIPLQLQGLLRDHFASAGNNRGNLLERDIIDLSRVSLDANDKMRIALEGAPSFTTEFPRSSLGKQLAQIARTIAVRDTLGASRQVFYVRVGGFDTHSDQTTTLPYLQQDLSDSIAAFYAATQELGVEQDVTSFTMSDFGRTLTANGNGTDHGWGGHHFVVGGSVRGGDIYGDIPKAELGHAQDAGSGRLIPTMSVQQFAKPLGSWFGLSDEDLNTALPGLSEFPTGGPNLFV